MNKISLLFALMAIGLWSSNAIVAKYTLKNMNLDQVQFLQYSGAFFVLLIVTIIRRASISYNLVINFSNISIGFVGLFGTMIFQYLGFMNGPIAQVNLITYMWPILITIITISFRKTDIPISSSLASIFGFYGVFLIIIGHDKHTNFNLNYIGYTFAFLSAACMAAYSYFSNSLLEKHSNLCPTIILLPAAFLGALGTGLWCLFSGSTWDNHPFYLALGLYLGVGPIGMGYFFWSLSLRAGSPDRIAILGYLTPMASTALLLLSGETLSPNAVAGAIMVLASCLVVTMIPKRIAHARNT